jgi:hypothetical protein
MAETLKTNGSVAVGAGWSNIKAGGHAMVIEAILEKNGTATVRLFNQGAGSSWHEACIDGTRERKAAYLEKYNIPQNIVTSPAFWMILTGTRVPAELDKPYSAEDVYSYFHHCIPGSISASTIFKLPQRSGTCAFKAILAYLKTKMSEEEYDAFILKFKFGVLVRYEEDLLFRVGSIGIPEQAFLKELRAKLYRSVETQRAVGRITDKLADLLKAYCREDTLVNEEKRISETKIQLVSAFALNSTSLPSEENSDKLKTAFNKSIHMHSNFLLLPSVHGIDTKSNLQHLITKYVDRDVGFTSKELRDLYDYG